MSIKVANVIEEGRMGGPQRRIVEVAARMNSDRPSAEHVSVESIVFLPRKHSTDFQLLLEERNVKYRTIPLTGLSRNLKILLSYCLSFPFEVWCLFASFRKDGIDIVHSSGGAWQFKGVIAGKLACRRVIWHLNDTGMPLAFRTLCGFLTKHFVDALFLAGNRVKDYYLGQDVSRNDIPFFTIQAPVDCSFFDPNKIEQDSIEAEDKLTNIVTIGNVNPFKGYEFFLHMAELLTHSRSDLSFHIAGALYESQNRYIHQLMVIKQQCNLRNVHFLGKLRDIRALLKTCHIYVCSSVAEASPISVWEAMAMEKAIVSTDVGDVAQFIRDGSSGFIVPVADPSALAEKVAILVENPDLRIAFGRKARATAVEFLDVSVAARNHQEAYRAVMSG